jgi:hypothetical protein
VPDLVGLIRPLNAGKRPVEARHEFLTHRGVAVEGGRGCHRLNLAAMSKEGRGFRIRPSSARTCGDADTNPLEDQEGTGIVSRI